MRLLLRRLGPRGDVPTGGDVLVRYVLSRKWTLLDRDAHGLAGGPRTVRSVFAGGTWSRLMVTSAGSVGSDALAPPTFVRDIAVFTSLALQRSRCSSWPRRVLAGGPRRVAEQSGETWHRAFERLLRAQGVETLCRAGDHICRRCTEGAAPVDDRSSQRDLRSRFDREGPTLGSHAAPACVVRRAALVGFIANSA
jgi:hypothetical protein